MKPVAPILLALILGVGGCSRDDGRAPRQSAPPNRPAASTAQPSGSTPGATNQAAAPSKPSTTAPRARAFVGPLPAGVVLKAKPSGHTESKVKASISANPDAVQTVRPIRLYEDPERIQAGMSYNEMIRRFGPASLKATAVPGRNILSYPRRKRHVQVEVENGIVTAVMWTETK